MTEPCSLSALRVRFDAELAASGDVRDPTWLAAFRTIPRDPFVPHFFTQTPDTPGWRLVEPSSPQWRESVYSMAPLITQIDGDDSLTETARTGQAVNGPATSSSSAPTLMGLMLQALDVHDGQTVLEVGTGTGYNTALLCHRLGPDNVTSMDVDPALITRAGERLAALGYIPHLVAGDGRDGCPERAPFDRVIATVGLGRVPVAWIDQTRDGGRLLVPLDRRSCGGLLALLTVHGSRASGPFLPDFGGFMPVRTERGHDAALTAFREVADHEGTTGSTTLGVEVATDNAHPAEFFATLTVPGGGWDHMTFIPDDGGPTETWLGQQDGSWTCHTTTDDGTHTVRQGGPRRLWDAIEHAHDEWQRLGQPVRERFGLTVEHDHHVLWLDQPVSHYTWSLDR